MTIQDPAGLLQRIPELRELCEDAGVRRAVEGGDPFKVYRALRWARTLGRLRSHRETIDALLRHRRLFARPIQRVPWLGTVNSFGAGFVGASEQDPNDGTSIATHAIIALFAIPLFPLGAYVVRSAEGGNPLSGRSWSIFARVPMGLFPWLYSRALALGVVALVAAGAVNAFIDSRSQDVHLANGFNETVVVTLGGKTERVPARSVRVLNVPTGFQHGTATTEGGVEVDVLTLDVRSDVDVLGWNLAGGAAVFRDQVEYRKVTPPKEDSRDEPTEVYCGQRTFVVKNAHDIFRKPPSSVNMPSSQRVVTRTWVDLMPEVEDHLETCRSWLTRKNRLDLAVPFLEAQARLSGWSEAETNRVVQLAAATHPTEGVRLAKAALAARPDDLDFHRMYQWAAENAGQYDALVAEYRQRAEAAPDSAIAQYLSVRLMEGPEAIIAMEKLSERFPEEAVILRSVIYSRTERGNWPGTHEAWERLRKLDLALATESLESEAMALVALGKRREAEALLKDMFSASEEPVRRVHTAELYARVARPDKDVAPDALLAELEPRDKPEEKLWLFRARAGLPTEEAPRSREIQLMQVIGRDPVQAMDIAPLVTPLEVRGLSRGSWALTYGEAVRTGSATVEQVLGSVPFIGPRDLAMFRRFVRGEDLSADALRVDPEVRAAACVVRARDTKLPAEERQRLLERAKREDVLAGPVSEAIATWSL